MHMVRFLEVLQLICLQIELLDDVALLHVHIRRLPLLLLKLVDFSEIEKPFVLVPLIKQALLAMDGILSSYTLIQLWRADLARARHIQQSSRFEDVLSEGVIYPYRDLDMTLRIMFLLQLFL